ncbi:methyltransferase domain-containing protein [Polynucleobacter paneuropaeus]|nr:methyltransferase domain-containing protein [Polynucleobacter paneuropaeus]MBT8553443.1 methyltransferase domain-containing protein [Polynucleobacter paneuropaeus]MBT8586397.1 methyltransferase domain-containing protein [Polynucleobacter paneuropaeus]MBT8592860.1 methyltransferase domain-containing protein [Polynucleobacter paneuropaeus]MBT8594774.1 methyltransferase domain-containing protein [Polynucleobacter paneuropaeus]
MSQVRTIPIEQDHSDYGLFDRLYILKDKLIANSRFQNTVAKIPFLRGIAKKRANQLFDVMAGFVYTQILLACIRLNIFNQLKDGPLTLEAIKNECGLERAPLKQLLDAAVSIHLLEIRANHRYGLGKLGAPLVGNSALAAMIEHHSVLYEDLRDPLLLLSGKLKSKKLEKFWPYVSNDLEDQESLKDQERVKDYSDLMSASLPLVADQVLGAYDFSRHRCLLDIGGGQGTFLKRVHLQSPQLERMLFDLPGVANLAELNFSASSENQSIKVFGGDFFKDELPSGADLITLIRVIFDHDDERVKILLRSIFRALSPGGKLLIAEPMAETPDHPPMGHAYFGFYLMAMGRGRPRTVEEIGQLALEAGFKRVEILPSDMPINAQVLLISA